MFKKQNFLLLALFFILNHQLFAQLEDVPISNSVYNYLLRLESLGFMPHKSLSNLPLQKNEIIAILKNTEQQKDLLSTSDQNILNIYEKEFGILPEQESVLFYSETDSLQLIPNNIFNNTDKLIYRYNQGPNSVEFRPLGSLDLIQSNNKDSSSKVGVGTLGLRLNGTISNSLGFYLQATNGRRIFGDKNLASYNPEYEKSIKFTRLNSDIDLTQSHVTYQNDWFRAKIGREEQQLGAGLNQRVFMSTVSPPMDAVTLSAIFGNFRYDYSLVSLIGYVGNKDETGFNARIPSKYLNYHVFSILPSWGEISFWDAIIYSDRGLELAYLNPLTFLKSLEHQLHDRDNSLMGLDWTIRPFGNFQIKSSFLLDDIIIEKIGTGYWSNKTAFNIAAINSFKSNFDLGIEYARVEPYTFSHFNYQDAYTNDSLLIGSNLLPNSEQFSLLFNYWWGQRYPISLKVSYTLHGANVYDSTGKLIKNVGGDPFISIRNPDPGNGIPGDSYTVTFLDGDLQKTLSLELSAGYSVFNNLNLILSYQYLSLNSNYNNYLRFFISLNEF